MTPSMSSLKSMSFDKLSKLREQVESLLNAKVAEERRVVQDRLNELDRMVGTGARTKTTGGRGSRGAVAPKYRNPDNLAETWAGRGLKPRWLSAALKAGAKLEDFSIEASGKGGAGRRKKMARQ